MIYSFTLALYSPLKGKHSSQKWECNHTNAQLIFDHAVKTLSKKSEDSKVVLVSIDDSIKNINTEL